MAHIENQSVVILGGFGDCLAADANQQEFSDLLLIDGSTLAKSVLFITGADKSYINDVILKNGFAA